MPRRSQEPKSLIIAASAGSLLEMYDFCVYAFFAPIIAPHFFPKESKLVAILLIFGIFAVGYFARPIGGILYGLLGDRVGRKKMLINSILFMAIPSLLIGLLPSYAIIGLLAPLSLIILRILQGLAVGGEFPGAVIFIAEHVQSNNRGLMCSWINFSITVGIVFASLVGAILTLVLSHQQLITWGWRIPFLLGSIIAYIGFILRKNQQETPVFKQMLARGLIASSPIKEVLGNDLSRIFVAICIVGSGAICVSLFFLFMPTYLELASDIKLVAALWINAINLIIFGFSIVLMGHFSDRYGRRAILSLGTSLLVILTIPLYLLLLTHHLSMILLALLSFSILTSMIMGPLASTLAELFPAKTRYTSYGISFNIGLALFGGASPYIALALIHKTGLFIAPSFCIIAVSLLSFIVIHYSTTVRNNIK